MIINNKIILLIFSILVVMLFSTHNIQGIFKSESSEELKLMKTNYMG